MSTDPERYFSPYNGVAPGDPVPVFPAVRYPSSKGAGARVNWTDAADMPHDETPIERVIAAMRKADETARASLPEPPLGYGWHATLEFEGIDHDFATRGADAPAFARITYRLRAERDW